MTRTLVATLAAGLAAVLLSGCALLSSPDPVQLYRFGDTAPGDGPGAAAVAVALGRIEFPAAAEGDRILTVNGVTAAYVGGARWVSPASRQFQDALTAAFLRDARRVRLVQRRESARSETVLDLEVLSFETRYLSGADAAPTVVLHARARLVAFPEREVTAERSFRIERPAAENRVRAIVAAYDAAVADFNAELVTWADAAVG